MRKILPVLKVIFLAVAIAVLAAFFASSNPDGLDKVSKIFGFEEKSISHVAPMADYRLPFIKPEGISTALAGALGTLIMFGIFWGTAKLSKKM